MPARGVNRGVTSQPFTRAESSASHYFAPLFGVIFFFFFVRSCVTDNRFSLMTAYFHDILSRVYLSIASNNPRDQLLARIFAYKEYLAYFTDPYAPNYTPFTLWTSVLLRNSVVFNSFCFRSIFSLTIFLKFTRLYRKNPANKASRGNKKFPASAAEQKKKIFPVYRCHCWLTRWEEESGWRYEYVTPESGTWLAGTVTSGYEVGWATTL